MMKHFSLICLAALCSQAFSQAYMNHWYFGVNTSLNFSSGVPVFNYSPMKSHEANACLSDSAGNLLFYTNGESIWDKEGNMMPHGDSLEIGRQVGIPFKEGSSVTQGVLILSNPGHVEQYYVFYLAKGLSQDPYSCLRLMYSIVDMDLNDGNGDVIPSEKNIAVSESGDYMWESMTAVKHGNGKDWWLIGLSGRFVEPDSSYFEKFLITEEGISSPAFQFYDLWSSSYEALFTEIGQMKFSQTGDKLANTRGSDIDIFNFDRCTGLLAHRLTIDTVHNQTYGVEFSPDASKLYVSTQGESPNKPGLFQLCLDCLPIVKTPLYTHPTNYHFGQLQLAPDGKIYTSLTDTNAIYDHSRYLDVINNPDSFGLACDFEFESLVLGDSGYIRYGLPNFVNYDLPALTTPCDTADTTDIAEQIIDNNEFHIYPNPANTFITLFSQVNYSNTTAKIYTAAGVKVKEIKIVTSTQKINIENFANGVYFFTVKQNEEIIFREGFVKE